jgi:hypothetical protein
MAETAVLTNADSVNNTTTTQPASQWLNCRVQKEILVLENTLWLGKSSVARDGINPLKPKPRGETHYFPKGEKEHHFVRRFPGYARSSFW